MERKFKRPKNKEELEQLEVEGLWKAIALSRAIGESNEKITLDVILKIHRVIFQFAIPGIAGKFRKEGEDIKKLKYIEPPPGRFVQQKMYEFARELDLRMAKIPRHPNVSNKKRRREWVDSIFYLATWVQYQIVAIHPFCDGNGRLARLMTNLVLRRYGLPASQVRFEGEDKAAYLNKLGQIDRFQDFEPLKKQVIESVIESIKKEEKIRMAKRIKRS